MLKLGLGLLAGVLLVGCSSKESERLMQTYTQKQDNYKLLQKTEKLQFKENNETKLLVTVTYLNARNIENKATDDEVFLVGIYNEQSPIESFSDAGFSLKLQNVKTKKEHEKEIKRRRQEEDLRVVDTNNTTIKKKSNAIYLNPIDIQSIGKDDNLLTGISFVSQWSQFYLVKFRHISGNRLHLIIQSGSYGTGSLDFAKVAKYAL